MSVVIMSERDHHSTDAPSRRTYLKTLGGTTAITVGLAGCLEGNGGNGNGNGGGNGGDNGGTTGGGDDDRKEIQISSFPTGISYVMYRWAEREGVWEEKFDERGYDVNIAYMTESNTQFVAGNVDIATDVTALEGARMGAEQGIKTAAISKTMNDYLGQLISPESEYAPSNTGSVEATIDRLDEDDAPVGLISWSAGTTPPTQIIYEGLFDKQFNQDTSSFTLQQASPPALPKLIMEGDLEVAVSSPFHGAADFLANGDLEPLFWHADIMSEEGLGTPPLEHLTVRQSFLDEHPDAARAAVEALDEATTWLHEDGAEEIPGDEEFGDAIAADSTESLEYAANWITNDPDVSYPIETEAVHEDVTVTDEWVSEMETYLDNGVDIGAVPEEWREHVIFEDIR
jgi:hypothetical protein